MQCVPPASSRVARMCRLPDWKCVDRIVWWNPQALIYHQRGKQVGPGQQGRRILAAGGITDFLDNWGRRLWASQPYLQVPVLDPVDVER